MYNSHFQKDMALVVLNQNLFAKAKMSFRISIVPTKLYLFNFGIKFTFTNKIHVELIPYLLIKFGKKFPIFRGFPEFQMIPGRFQE